MIQRCEAIRTIHLDPPLPLLLVLPLLIRHLLPGRSRRRRVPCRRQEFELQAREQGQSRDLGLVETVGLV